MANYGGYSRTDLACESVAGQKARQNCASVRDYTRGGFEFSELIIKPEDESGCGKKAGRYVTSFPGKMWMWDEVRAGDYEDALAGEIRDFTADVTGKTVGRDTSVMICGIGNRSVTPDALGPRVIDCLTVTRHVMGEGGIFDRMGCSRISAIAPGTLGQTGIEALDLIRGAVAETSPDAVIVIDALAARSTERLSTTVQLSDAGICPGSGIGNSRREISRDTVGVPVIALGVPTVVDSSTLVWDVLGNAGLGDAEDRVREVLDRGKDFFVSPKECDTIIENVAKIIAVSIEEAFGLYP